MLRIFFFILITIYVLVYWLYNVYVPYNTCCWMWLAKDRQLELRMEWCASELRRVSKAIKPASDFSAQIVVSVLSSQHSTILFLCILFSLLVCCVPNNIESFYELCVLWFLLLLCRTIGEGGWWWVGVVGVEPVDLVLLQICIHSLLFHRAKRSHSNDCILWSMHLHCYFMLIVFWACLALSAFGELSNHLCVIDSC